MEVKIMITIVSGLPRSGTSLMMSMLKHGGLELLVDHIRKADDDNPKGYFEFERVKKLPEGDYEWLASADGKVVKIVSYFLDKLPSNFQYKVVFVEREISEILKSQKKMMINRGEKIDDEEDNMMRKYFENHLRTIKKWLSEQSNFEVKYTSYNQIMKNPDKYATEINDFFDNSLDVQKMSKVIDKKLYRQKSN